MPQHDAHLDKAEKGWRKIEIISLIIYILSRMSNSCHHLKTPFHPNPPQILHLTFHFF